MNSITNQNSGDILIVDDEPENLKVLSLLLTNNGYKIRAAKTGKDALSSIHFHIPDLVLLDIRLPDIGGYEICANIKSNEESKDLPVLFLSGLKDTNDIVRGFSVGGQDFITKPFKVEEVLARVKTHIQLYLLQKEFESQALELKNTNEKLEKEIAISKEVESMRQKNKEITELNITRDKFFSIIAHDLKGPFVGFLGLTEMMQTENLSIEEMREYGKIMNKSASNLFKLLENLLTWARVQRGVIEFKPENHSLPNVVNQTVSVLSEFAKQKNIELVSNIPNEITVFADLEMLNTILRNLLSNAIKFTVRGGKVVVTAEEKEKEILIKIEDNGIGMDEFLLDGIFKIDKKTSRQGTEKESSTGLGLLLCKEFVEKHNGKIWAESEVDKGSTFYFTIPNK